jgi:hypothetical protein
VESVLPCRSIGGSKDGCQLASLLQERRVMMNVAVLEVLKPIDALIGFLEGDVQFRLELGSRAALPRCSIVGSNGIC